MSECQQDLRKAGKPYPRTCAVCGLGQCQKYPKEPSTPTVTIPCADLAALKAEHEAAQPFAGKRFDERLPDTCPFCGPGRPVGERPSIGEAKRLSLAHAAAEAVWKKLEAEKPAEVQP